MSAVPDWGEDTKEQHVLCAVGFAIQWSAGHSWKETLESGTKSTERRFFHHTPFLEDECEQLEESQNSDFSDFIPVS